MAIEKSKTVLRERAALTDTAPVHKSGRNRHPTACRDLRRRPDPCGFCGSGNVVWYGIAYCPICGRESEVMYDQPWGHPLPFSCCRVPYTDRRGIERSYPAVRLWTHAHCLDCSAVEAPPCPACHRPAWSHGLAVFCRCCSFASRQGSK